MCVHRSMRYRNSLCSQFENAFATYPSVCGAHGLLVSFMVTFHHRIIRSGIDSAATSNLITVLAHIWWCTGAAHCSSSIHPIRLHVHAKSTSITFALHSLYATMSRNSFRYNFAPDTISRNVFLFFLFFDGDVGECVRYRWLSNRTHVILMSNNILRIELNSVKLPFGSKSMAFFDVYFQMIWRVKLWNARLIEYLAEIWKLFLRPT